MVTDYNKVVSYLESLQIMPKTMPGLEKIKKALLLTSWYQNIDANKVIVVAGTNGKGTTCAALESLLLEAKQQVGFYCSPHLVSTTERIRLNGLPIPQEDFVTLFKECEELIEKCQLSHFEALTLMAGHYFFSPAASMKQIRGCSQLDFIILEVGLGGTYDATNAFPHKYSVITKLGLDHMNILGHNIVEIAKNKFGIVSAGNTVVYHALPPEVFALKESIEKQTHSKWIESEKCEFIVETRFEDSDGVVNRTQQAPKYFLEYNKVRFEINMIGRRAAENIMTALTIFRALDFSLRFSSDRFDVRSDTNFYAALNKIRWPGRMQKVNWPNLTGFFGSSSSSFSQCPLYISGDHNEQGIQSLIEILNDFKWKTLHLVVGIGVDKDANAMLKKLGQLKNMKLYLTETPFKGLKINEYPDLYKKTATEMNPDVTQLLKHIFQQADTEDLVLVTGSLYLVGQVLNADAAQGLLV